MAQKKKSAAKRQKQQQKKQQRRTARQQKRRPSHAAGDSSLSPVLGPGSFTRPTDASVLNDLRLLFPGGDPATMDANSFANTLLPIAWDSADLADEPEFADIAIPPLEATQMYVEVIEEQGVEDEDIADLNEEERDEVIAEALDETTYRLLTPELRKQIRTGLTDLRARLRRSNQPNEIPRVAAIQLFIEMDQDGRIAASLGLVQEIVRRSISFGFEMAEVIAQVHDEEEASAPLTPEALHERVAQSGITQKLTATLGKVPGLRRFFEQQIDKMLDAGRRALFEGKLRLDLYSADELAAALALVKQATNNDLTLFTQFDKSVEQIMPRLAPKIIDYVRTLFTPDERFAQLRQRMDAVVADPAFADSTWTPFLLTFHRDVMEEEGLDFSLGFLVAALYGELWPLILPPEAFAADQEAE